MRVAAVQMDIAIGQKEKNLQNILLRMKEAAQNKAELVIFPECSLQGYCFPDREEAFALGEEISGAICTQLAQAAKELGCTAVVGFLERDGDNLFNSALVVGARGVLGVHRKIHLLHLGVDRFTTLGDIPFPLFQAGDCKFGVNICYDCSFPESGRAVKLKGAQLLAIPTNWPSSSDSWEHTPKVRATENHIFVVAADRVGEERGFTFAGHSQIIDCEGHTLAEAGASEETILFADIDPVLADKNRVIKVPGEYEFDRIASRRPEMYEGLGREK
jgi:predicted amidohydrolase